MNRSSLDAFDKSVLLEPKLSENANYVAQTRYGMKDRSGKILESVKDIFWRVAINVAKGDKNFGKDDLWVESLAKSFYQVMAEQIFLPNTPCLFNAGKENQQLSACFVLPIEDSMESIIETMGDMARIHKSGGGTGFSFSKLRPCGDYIASSGGTTVGPVSFLQAYNDLTAQVKQGGVRRGANMGMLSIDHPDVLRFAVAKLDEFSLTNFNISLAVTDVFMKQMETDKKYVENMAIPEEIVKKIKEIQGNRDVDVKTRRVEKEVRKLYEWARAKEKEEGYDLINPRTGESMMKLNAFKVFKLVTRLAWQYGDPGLVFIDRMNEPCSNPVPKLGRIEATNPCGEQPLLPYDACNLGSVNLSNFVVDEDNDLDWSELEKVVRLAVHFLDNVIEVNRFPIEKIKEMVSKTRRIGLGVMGFADMLFKLGIAYDSEKGVEWAEKVMEFINRKAKEMTVELASERGVFSAWEISVFANTSYRPRNMALTTIAPTGTISIVADASSGIEPVFSLVYKKNMVEGKTMFSVNPVFVSKLKKMGLYSEELMERIADNGGKLIGLKEFGLSEEELSVFKTALEIEPEWHVRIQGAFQKYVDNAVSKTINFPKEAGAEDVEKAYRLAYRLGTKGITIYRAGSREKEVLSSTDKKGNGKDGNPPSLEAMARRRKKKTPEIARGVRMKKTCDVGNVYTSVFFESGDGPVEVFVVLGKGGGYMAGAAEVTGRLASLSLKYGASLEEVAEEMVGISCGQRVGMGNKAVLSMFDAVGKSLLEISRGEQLKLFEVEKGLEMMEEKIEIDNEVLSELRVKQVSVESRFMVCPDCGSQLCAQEGCLKCINSFCGYSKCS